MEISDITILIAAFGDVQGITEAVKWWRGRKVQDRHELVGVEAKEKENNRKQVDWLEKRLGERDAKIDALYIELRNEQNAKLEEIHLRHETELQLKEAEVKKCCKRGCGDRMPPSDY